jgi:hypothetical protein
MPCIRLSTIEIGIPMPVATTSGSLLIPRLQFRCLARLPGLLMPKDGIIDTGSPLSWFPEAIWSFLQPGLDYEILPFVTAYSAPRTRAANWSFSFRMARLLRPIALFSLHTSTELIRIGPIVQFADGNPPLTQGGKGPPRIVIGLWGGFLEETSLRTWSDPLTNHAFGELVW